jgi:hypothetical protein
MITGIEAESFYKDLPDELEKYYHRKDNVSYYVEKVCEDFQLGEYEDIFIIVHDFTERFYSCKVGERVPSLPDGWSKYKKEALNFLKILDDSELELKEITFRSEKKAEPKKAPISIRSKLVAEPVLKRILDFLRQDENLRKELNII